MTIIFIYLIILPVTKKESKRKKTCDKDKLTTLLHIGKSNGVDT